MKANRVSRWAASAIMLATLGNCGGDGKAALPAGPPLVTITMLEYRFGYPTPVPFGRVVFRFVNAGRLEHQPDLIPVPEDFPPIDDQLRGDVRAVVTPFAGIPPRRPGQLGTFAVDLVPGQRYVIVCFARDPGDDESHALKGMTTEFRAGAQPTTTTRPG